MEKLKIYHSATDVTVEVSICMYMINIFLIGIIMYKLSSEIISWKLMIVNALLNIGNLFGGTYIYRLWDWCNNNYKEGIKLRYNYSIEYKLTIQDKINCCRKLYEKYPQLLISDKQKIENDLMNTKLDDLPNVIETYNEKRLLIIQEMSKKVQHETDTASNVSSIYEYTESIKQAILAFYTGSYWYIGWGISLAVLTILLVNKERQPEFGKREDLDKLIVEKLKKKFESPDIENLKKYWDVIKGNPELIKKISADIYQTPCLARKDRITSRITHESPFDYAQESNDLLMELIQLSKQTSQEDSEARTKLGTELHDLSIKYNELETLYNKIQPRIEQAEMKVNSRLINVAKDIIEKIE
jgi:hypothetical protein